MLKVFIISDSKTREKMVSLVLLWECELGVIFLHEFWKYVLNVIEHVCLVTAILHLGIFPLSIFPTYMQNVIAKCQPKCSTIWYWLSKYIAFSRLNICCSLKEGARFVLLRWKFLKSILNLEKNNVNDYS